MSEKQATTNDHEKETLSLVMERLDKLLESWKRHLDTHESIDARIRLLTYKIDDVEAAVKAAMEIVKEYKDKKVETTDG